MTTRTSALATLVLLLAACETPHIGSPPPSSTRASNCVPMQLANGQRVCLQAEPLGPTSATRTTHDGASVQPLTDPDLSGMLPTSVDLRTTILNGCIQMRNQGECGWCTVHAVGNALDALYCAEGCGPTRVSMPALWYSGHGNQLGALDCDTGWGLDQGIQAVTSSPSVAESVWPFSGSIRSMLDAQPSDLTQDPRTMAMGSTPIAITNDDAELDAMKHVLASNRAVVVWSGVCPNSEWRDGSSTIHSPTSDCSDADRGYHAYNLVGFDDTTQEFLALNSWGTSWGQAGYMHISYEWVRTEILGAYYLSQIDRSHGACAAPDMMTTATTRCGAIQGCDACTSTSGCVFCDGNCVAADAAHGCQNTVLDPSVCPLPINNCGIHNDCGDCAADPACAWCSGRGDHGACLAWPGDYLSCEDGSRVATATDQCNTATGTCARATDCDSCAALEGCGWCESGSPQCTGASSTNPDSEACAMGFVAYGESCSAADAGPAEMDAGMDHADASSSDPDAGTPDAGSMCSTLACGDCVATFGCEFCQADRRCYDDSEAAACTSDVTRDGAACDVCHDPGGTCNSDADCCFAGSSPSIQCIDHVCSDTSMCVLNGGACTFGGAGCCGGGTCGVSPSMATECCLVPGYECTSDAQCCGYSRCSSGHCQSRHTGQACLNTQECENGDVCLDSGVCGT